MDLGLAADKCKISGGLTTVNIWMTEHSDFKRMLMEAKQRVLYRLTASMVEKAEEKPGVQSLKMLDTIVTDMIDVDTEDIPTEGDDTDNTLEQFGAILGKFANSVVKEKEEEKPPDEPKPEDLARILDGVRL